MSEAPQRTPDAPQRFAVRGPDLYQDNIFRVTGLPVQATPQMIRRQREKFRVAFEVGTSPPRANGRFALDPPPEESAVNAAFEGFRDPQRRLVDELFWFWRAGAAPDGASANSADVNADHDRAVAAHCTALDLERADRQRPLTTEERSRRDTCWSEAIQRWAALNEAPQIWERLRERVTEIDDPRLTVDTVDDILDNLPIRLVTIHAELALDLGHAQRHRKLIDQFVAATRLDTARVDTALRAVVAPTLSRIETACEAARSASARNPADGCATGAHLLDQLRPVVETVGAVLTPTHSAARAARDQLADTLNLCAARQANATKVTDSGAQARLTAVLTLLREAEKFACLAATTKLISGNIESVRQSHAQALRHSQGAAPRSAPPTIGPAPDPRTGSEIFAELRRTKRGPWSYVDQLCREGRPNLAHDALALWGRSLAKDPTASKQIDTLLSKPAPFVARMKQPPTQVTKLGCGLALRSHRPVSDGNVVVMQYLVLFFIPLIPLAAYLARPNRSDTLAFVGKVPLGMGPRYWRKLLTAVSVIALAVLVFGGGALFWIMVLRIGIQVCKVRVLRHNIRQSLAR